ncbi:MAG: PEP-CTERM sorting domain-containing protein [Akkermansia sp.]|nr:PEP-CTERM sorting domain-containing protein [Akkermansia sp.]
MPRLRHTILTLLALMSPQLMADTLWVPGVNVKSGWIDYEKNEQKGDGDDYLCWAASAANIIDYWQRQYTVPAGTPTGAAVWDTFKAACRIDDAGFVPCAIQWWLGGDYQGITGLDDDDNNDRAVYAIYSDEEFPQPIAITTDIDTFGGYYWDLISTVNSDKLESMGNFLLYDGPELTGAFVTLEQIQAGLAAGAPLSLGIGDTNEELFHSITLWGIEYDEKGLQSIWITDSDDYKTQLLEVDVMYKEEDPLTLYLDLYSDDPKYGDVYIYSSSYVNVAESNTWNLTPVIPEPATTTLSLLALSALAARRRRK